METKRQGLPATKDRLTVAQHFDAWLQSRQQTVRPFHDLRHGAATMLQEAGVDPRTIASIMGWSPATASAMLARYAHVRDVLLDDAARRLENRLALIPGLASS